MLKTARLSDDGVYRYALGRTWDTDKPVLSVVMVNPSTADAKKDDPTILSLIRRAKGWGFGGIHVVNLFGLRSSTQSVLQNHADPFGPDNPQALTDVLLYATHRKVWVLAAWGNGGNIWLSPQPGTTTPAHKFRELARARGVELRCLGLTQSGAPKHPLARGVHRIPNDFEPVVFA